MKKIKKYKGKVPIYGGEFVLVVAEDLVEGFKSVPAVKYDPEEFEGTRALFFLDTKAKTMNNRCYYLFFRSNATVPEIVHEVIHWKNRIFDYHGVDLDLSNDEHEAYFVDFLVNYIFKKIYPAHSELYKK